MRLYPDPASMTPDERFGEIARILAAGLLRRWACPVLSADPGQHRSSQNPPESVQNCLAVVHETGLSVHTS